MKKHVVALGSLAAAGALVIGLVVGTGVVAAQTPPTQTPGAQQQQTRGWLGVVLNESNNQVTVRSVVPDSPAARAGIQANDRIVSINGQNVTTIAQVQNILNPLQPNAQVQIVLNRNNATQTVTVTLGTVPARGARGGGLFGLPFGPRINLPFDNFRGGSFAYVDEQGRTQTIVTTMGRVTSVDAANNRVTIEKNGGGSQTFRVDANTRLRGTLAELQTGTQVVVTANQSAPDLALSIHAVGARGGLRGPKGPAPGATR
ncbi:MAG: PDZ domain-containing protein [Chloroflexota bacterium]|nr:PDZ domain-containing protein [Dehalococcoidia bacterium]MDW8254500.1 PDZ domain-containing protein [Chloroflexota bacterium]